MAKKEEACACPVCGTGLCKTCSLVAVIVGVLYLLADYGVAAVDFWKVSWYTVAFLMVGGFCLLSAMKK